MGSGVQRSPTKPANTSSHCCPSTAEAVANGGSTAPSSTASSGTSRGPARPGATCPKGTRSLADLCYDRFVRCRRRDGTRDRLLSHARTKNDAVGGVEWEVSVDDDTVIRAHQHHAAGARGEPRARRTKKGALEPRRRGPGTHQRRFLHREVAPRLRWQEEGQAAAVVRGVLTPGQRHGSTRLEELCWTRCGYRAPARLARSRPRKRPAHTCSPTGATELRESCVEGRCYAGAASPTPSPSAKTRRSAARGVRDAGPPVSTERLTAGATWSRGA